MDFLECHHCGYTCPVGCSTDVCPECGKPPFAVRAKHSRAGPTAVVVLLVVNTFLFLAAYKDQSWGAAAIQILIGPVVNLIIMVVALLALVVPKGKSRPSGYRWHVFVATAGPIVAAGILWLAVAMLPVSGC